MPHDHSDPDHAHALLPSDPALRVKSLETILTRKGLVDPAALDAIIDYYENRVGPRNGADVVARAWSDPAFKGRLLQDAPAAIDELGYLGKATAHLKVVENLFLLSTSEYSAVKIKAQDALHKVKIGQI